MAALIIGLLMHVAYGNVVSQHRKINKKSLAGEGFEPATFSVTGEHATH
jgi:hypothetical protein